MPRFQLWTLAGDTLVKIVDFEAFTPKDGFVANCIPKSLVLLLKPIVWYATCQNRTMLKIAYFFQFFPLQCTAKICEILGVMRSLLGIL